MYDTSFKRASEIFEVSGSFLLFFSLALFVTSDVQASPSKQRMTGPIKADNQGKYHHNHLANGGGAPLSQKHPLLCPRE